MRSKNLVCLITVEKLLPRNTGSMTQSHTETISCLLLHVSVNQVGAYPRTNIFKTQKRPQSEDCSKVDTTYLKTFRATTTGTPKSWAICICFWRLQQPSATSGMFWKKAREMGRASHQNRSPLTGWAPAKSGFQLCPPSWFLFLCLSVFVLGATLENRCHRTRQCRSLNSSFSVCKA